MSYAIIIILIVAQAVREYFVQKERASLLDRIMSKNYEDFKNFTNKPEENQFEPDDDGLNDLESAKDEIVYGEEKE